MGKKVNPRAFRQVTTYRTPSRWFATGTDYASNLQTDVRIRKFLKKKFRDASVDRIEIERSAGQIDITIWSSKPGMIIGRGGTLIEETRDEVKKQFFGSEKIKVNISIQEVREPDLSAELVYQNIRDQIENRVPFRRAIKRGLEGAMRAGAQGCKIQISGRLNGADIARTEQVSQGRLPLQKLRANIDYSRGTAATVYGVIGIKVWIYKGDVFSEEDLKQQQGTQKKRRRRKSSGSRNKKYSGASKKGTLLRKKSDVEKDDKKKAE